MIAWLDLKFVQLLETWDCTTLRKLNLHFLSHWMGYHRSDSFPFDFEPNVIPFGSKSKGKLSPRSYLIQCERKWKFNFLSAVQSEVSHNWTNLKSRKQSSMHDIAAKDENVSELLCSCTSLSYGTMLWPRRKQCKKTSEIYS